MKRPVTERPTNYKDAFALYLSGNNRTRRQYLNWLLPYIETQNQYFEVLKEALNPQFEPNVRGLDDLTDLGKSKVGTFEAAYWSFHAADLAGKPERALEFYHRALEMARRSGRIGEFTRFIRDFETGKKGIPTKKKGARKK